MWAKPTGRFAAHRTATRGTAAPPNGEARDADAQKRGAQNGTAWTRRRTAIYHTSTCYVAGSRTGPIYEDDPRTHPFPRAEELGADAWDPDREIAECLDLVAQARHRSDDAFRQSEVRRGRAQEPLASRGEPVTARPTRPSSRG